MSWLDAVSQIDMKPITTMSQPAPKIKDEEFESSITSYKLPIPAEMRPVNAVVNKTKHMVEAGKMEAIHSYKQFFKRFAYLFRRINELSYGLSIVFFIIAIVGGFRGMHSITVMCVSAIVLLNVVGLAAAISNLIALQFRGNPIKGLLFLFPPIALYYLWTNSTKWKKPINRVLTPIVVLCAVIGAYMYIPWLNGSKSGQTSWQEAVGTLKHDLDDSLSEAREKAEELKDELPDDMKNINLEKIKRKAVSAVDDLKEKLQDAKSSRSKLQDSETPESSSDAEPAADDRPQKSRPAPRKNDSPQKSTVGLPANEIGRPKNVEIGGPAAKDP